MADWLVVIAIFAALVGIGVGVYKLALRWFV